MRLSFSTAVALLLAALCGPAASEYMPPPTLADLLRADYVATGSFVEKDGAIRFVPGQVLWGKPDVVDDLQQEDVRVEAGGRLIAWVWGGGRASGEPEDATRQAIWFFCKHGGIVAQPVELISDFNALRRGKRPSMLFELLQRLDVDMRRDALEELFADRRPDVIAGLYRIAMTPDSLAAYDAINVLNQTRLLYVERVWGRWTDHPAAHELVQVLRQNDSERVARELREAAATEKRPGRLIELLHWAREDVELNIRYLDHAADGVRGRALGNLYGSLLQLAKQPGKAAQTEALARRLLPLLKTRLKVETSAGTRLTLEQMLEERAGVLWVLRVPTQDEPPPPYSEAEERKFVVTRLTSSGRHGFVLESAGREIAEHFLDEGFEQLKVAAADSNSYTERTAYDAMGYVRHPRVFAYLVERPKSSPVWSAIGRQNQARSFDVLKRRIEDWCKASAGSSQAACDALAELRDPRALPLLKRLEGAISAGHARLPYLRARLAHGDPWALQKLLAELKKAEREAADDVIGALLLADAPEVTEALKQHIEKTWPDRWESFDDEDRWWCRRMENYCGTARRTTALGEVARRDARWLAGLALRKMESTSLSARLAGAHIFRSLTGHAFDARAFRSERAAPLKALQAWWAQHRTETREQWLLSHFSEKGFAMTRLHDRKSLPVLVQALAADPFTHGLALEQISVITGKYFGNDALDGDFGTISMSGPQLSQERMAIRVAGWLAARKMR